ncbi:2-hydroxyacid dehydrogenase [Xanthobacter oligotrophicus]|uniref:2-hydroxyacid dehydrogenase n=1 Tax=Xanthobacter oligotrophicus TaxID=2607286 RepID=UPI0011F26EEA|nr:2-hydroxyacid dehydrogenase [Xanthobacter oligotrophicus]MCG5234580.1 2-hydroxyacid dehydrogenase [Xanthobacter oligotrophicus]
MKPEIIQYCPLMPGLEAALAERFTVHRFFEDKDPDGFLTRHAGAIRGFVTGGHLGLPPDLGAKLPALEIVAINGVGFDKVDLVEAKRRGIRVANTPDVLTEDVADLAIGLSIALLRQIVKGDAYVRAGQWLGGDLALGAKVSRRRFGIFGLGRIGRAIARRLEGFDAQIAYSDRVKLDVPYAFEVTPQALAARSDVFVVAAAASAETRNVIDRSVIDAVGPKGILVNVARGSLVDEPALLAALKEGRIGGAALDVFADEPRVPDGFFGLPNVVLTPHMASATGETRQAMADLVLANLVAHFAGEPLPTALV